MDTLFARKIRKQTCLSVSPFLLPSLKTRMIENSHVVFGWGERNESTTAQFAHA